MSAPPVFASVSVSQTHTARHEVSCTPHHPRARAAHAASLHLSPLRGHVPRSREGALGPHSRFRAENQSTHDAASVRIGRQRIPLVRAHVNDTRVRARDHSPSTRSPPSPYFRRGNKGRGVDRGEPPSSCCGGCDPSCSPPGWARGVRGGVRGSTEIAPGLGKERLRPSGGTGGVSGSSGVPPRVRSTFPERVAVGESIPSPGAESA